MSEYVVEAESRYRGLNPAFVRRVWAKRRKEQPVPRPRGVKWTPEAKARIAEMMLRGCSYGQIARVFGCTSDAIGGVVHASKELKALRRVSTQHGDSILAEAENGQ